MKPVMKRIEPIRKRRIMLIGIVPVLIAAIVIPIYAYTQAPFGQKQQQRSGGITVKFKNEVKMEVKDGFREINCNGVPDHTVGQFPGAGNPNSISPQEYHYRVPMTPTLSNGAGRARAMGPQIFGVAVNGVPYDPGTGETWNGNFNWHYEALSGLYGRGGMLGADENFAHVQPNGAYHYHGLPMGLLKKLDYTHKMRLVGYAADGYPIYGDYGYSSPSNSNSPMKQLKSSYHLKSGNRPGGDGPGGAYDGSFASDFEYIKDSGDLDEFNGRTGVTPDYPNGTFYYVITGDYPFIPRRFKGTPDASFMKRDGGPGGPGGPSGRGGQGFGGPGGPGGQGFGGPGGQGGPGGGPGGQGFGGPGGQGGPGGGPGGQGFGGPGGQGGPGFPGGPPAGMVPLDSLDNLLGLTPVQKTKVAMLKKTMDALRAENFAPPSLAKLKLTDAQVRQIAEGKKVTSVLTSSQKRVFEANKRQFGGPGGPGGQGGPGNGGGFGGPPPSEL